MKERTFDGTTRYTTANWSPSPNPPALGVNVHSSPYFFDVGTREELQCGGVDNALRGPLDDDIVPVVPGIDAGGDRDGAVRFQIEGLLLGGSGAEHE
ncbi:hypothetical protein S7W_14525 [Mycobacteroides abscessus M94]|nr:hypothetical protein S7W_14525 [Mycobacteroides abscessus M94]